MKICFFISRYVDFLTQRPLLKYFGNSDSLIILAYSSQKIQDFISKGGYQYTENIDFIKATIFNYSALVTSSAMSHPAHSDAFNLTMAFKKAGLLTFELQHSINQLGVDFMEYGKKIGFDELLLVGYHPFYTSDYLITWKYSKNPLEIGPEFVPLGCPRIDDAFKLKKHGSLQEIPRDITCGKPYVLILSNSTRSLYKGQHNKSFLKLIYSLVDKYKNIQWILKLHPIETRSEIYPQLSRLKSKNNVTILHFSDDRLKDLELYDMLLGAKAAIVCNSSAALDAIYMGVPTFIFNMTGRPFYSGYREEIKSVENFLKKIGSFFSMSKIDYYSRDEFLAANLILDNEGHQTEKVAEFILEKIKSGEKKISSEQFNQYIDFFQRGRYYTNLMSKLSKKTRKNFIAKLKRLF